MSSDTYDVIVIGGGPGGSTAGRAARRVRPQGAAPRSRADAAVSHRRVADSVHVVHAEPPRCRGLAARVGVPEEVQRPVRLDHRQGVAAVLLLPDHPNTSARRPGRSGAREFDAMLLDNARKKGVEVRQGVTVRDVLMEGIARRRRARRRQGRREGPRRSAPRSSSTRRAAIRCSRASFSGRTAIPISTRLRSGATTKARCAIRGWTRARRPSPTCRRRDGSGTSRSTPTSSASAWSASRGISTGTRAIPTRSSIAKRRRAPGFAITSASAGRSGPVRVTGEYSYHSQADRRRRLLPRRRCVRVPRSAVLHRRVPGAEERRDGRRRHPRRARARGQVTAAHFDEYLRPAAARRHELPPARARVLRSLVQLPRVPPGLPAPARPHRRHARRQRLHRPDAALRRARASTRQRGTAAEIDVATAVTVPIQPSIATTGGSSSPRPTWPASCISASSSATWRKPSTRSGARPGCRSSRRDRRFGFPRVAASIEFHAPLHFEDEFEVHIRMAAISRRSIRYVSTITRGDTTHRVRDDDRRLRAATPRRRCGRPTCLTTSSAASPCPTPV